MARRRRRTVSSVHREKKKARQVRPAVRPVTAETPAAAPGVLAPTPARRPITLPSAATAAARRGVSRVSQAALHTDYAAIGRDLRRVIALCVLLLGTLVALSFALR